MVHSISVAYIICRIRTIRFSVAMMLPKRKVIRDFPLLGLIIYTTRAIAADCLSVNSAVDKRK